MLAFMLMATAIFTVTPAFADEPDPDPTDTTELRPWKTLRTNAGTYFEEEDFQFELGRIATDESRATDAHGIDSNVYGAPAIFGPIGSAPDPLPNPFVPAVPTWRELATVTIPSGIPTAVHADGGVFREVQATDMLATFDWTFAGVYTFRLREVTPATNPRVVNVNDAITETLQFATNEYEVHVQVGIDGDGEFYVQGIAVFRVVEGVRGPKIDPNDRHESDGIGAIDFTNNFVRTVNNIPDEPVCEPGDEDCPPELPPLCPPGEYPDCPELPNHIGLRVSKLVDGPGSQDNHVFTFTGMLTLPAVMIGEAPTSFVAEVWENDGTAAERTVTFVPGVVAGTFVPTGEGAAFTLSGEEHLRLPGLPVGTQFNFTETNRLHYTLTHVNVWLGGPAWSGAPGSPFGSDATNITTGNHLVTDVATHAAFVNVLDVPPITGIITNNMPLILAVAVGLGFFGIAATNKKRRAYE